MKKAILGICAFLILTGFCFSFEVKIEPAVGTTAFIKWVPASIPVQFFIDSKGSDDVPFAQVQDAIKKAFASWQNVTGQTIRFTFAGVKTGGVISTTDQTNVIQFIESNWPSSSFVLAITKTAYLIQNPPNLVDADIIINGVNGHWTNTTGIAKTDIQSTIQHEVGHLLGLQHSQIRNAAMLPTGNLSRVLSADEQAGVRFLYPSAPPVNFAILSPFNGAILLGGPNPASLGFPLTTYRWSAPAGFTNFTVQFSSVGTFSPPSKVKSFPRGTASELTETTAIHTQLKTLGGTLKKVFWRVQADTSAGRKTTTVASFTFQ